MKTFTEGEKDYLLTTLGDFNNSGWLSDWMTEKDLNEIDFDTLVEYLVETFEDPEFVMCQALEDTDQETKEYIRDFEKNFVENFINIR